MLVCAPTEAATSFRRASVAISVAVDVQEFVRVALQLVAKCEGYGDPLAPTWQSKLCAYASGATGVHAALEHLLQSPGLTPTSEAESATALEALQLLRQNTREAILIRQENDAARLVSPSGLQAVLHVRSCSAPMFVPAKPSCFCKEKQLLLTLHCSPTMWHLQYTVKLHSFLLM
jgi:hypothetical protein